MQRWNQSHGSGKDTSLELVPFESGEDPTAAPVCLLNSSFHDARLKYLSQHNLPVLSTVEVVRA